MNPDELEHLLQQREPKTLPAAWRKEILTTAYEARSATLTGQRSHRNWLTRKRLQWGALAAAWALAAFFEFSGRDAGSAGATPIAASPAVLDRWREQQRLLVEFLAPPHGETRKEFRRDPQSPAPPRRSGARGGAVRNAAVA